MNPINYCMTFISNALAPKSVKRLGQVTKARRGLWAVSVTEADGSADFFGVAKTAKDARALMAWAIKLDRLPEPHASAEARRLFA